MTDLLEDEGQENIRIFGMIEAVESSLRNRLVSLSRQSFFQTSDSATVADQLVDVIRTAATQRDFGDAIGSNCLSITLHSDPRMCGIALSPGRTSRAELYPDSPHLWKCTAF